MKFTQKKDDKVSHLAINNEGGTCSTIIRTQYSYKTISKKIWTKIKL